MPSFTDTGSVRIEEISEDEITSHEEYRITTMNTNETTPSGDETSKASTSALGHVSTTQFNFDIWEPQGNKNSPATINSMSEFLTLTNPTTTIEAFEAQGKIFDRNNESISEILLRCPKEFFFIVFPCLTILILDSWPTLFFSLICILICYFIDKFLSHRMIMNRDMLKTYIMNSQIQAISQQEKAVKETSLALAHVVKDMQENLTNASVQISNINKDVVTNKLEVLRQMQLAEIEGNLQIAKIKEDGSTSREKLHGNTETNAVTVKAATKIFKAMLSNETQVEFGKLKNQRREIARNMAVEIKKIDVETKLETLRNMGLMKAQYDKEQKIFKASLEAKLEKKYEAETPGSEESEVELEIEAEILTVKQRTEQIQMKGKTDRHQ